MTGVQTCALPISMLLTIISVALTWVINLVAIVILVLTKKWSLEWYQTGVSDLGIKSNILEKANASINRQEGDTPLDILAKIGLALQINKMVATSQDVIDGYKIIRVLASDKLQKQIGLSEDKKRHED